MNTRKKTVELLTLLAPRQGYNLTALADVRLLRSNCPLRQTPVLYDPGIVIVCQGSKQGYFGGEVYRYDAFNYLAVSVPVPFTMETEASDAEPLLAIYLHLDFNLAAELTEQIDQHGHFPAVPARSMFSTPVDDTFAALILRFMQVLANPLESAILGEACRREIYFRVLTGAQGGAMRAALSQRGKFGKIFRALQHIHAAYSGALKVEQLAAGARMSVPSFHSHFKTVTGTTPVQYVKSVRLHQARLLMLRNHTPAALAATEVGYESASQFGREFKRLFGLAPTQEIRRMKSSFDLPPPADTIFVSSH
jgi:AraC-like DNA-binding protein